MTMLREFAGMISTAMNLIKQSADLLSKTAKFLEDVESRIVEQKSFRGGWGCISETAHMWKYHPDASEGAAWVAKCSVSIRTSEPPRLVGEEDFCGRCLR